MSGQRRVAQTTVLTLLAAGALVLGPVRVQAAPAPMPAPVTYPFPVGGGAALAVDAAGATAYLLDRPDPRSGARGRLQVVDLASRRIVATVPLGRDPLSLALDEVRHRAYISNVGDVLDGSGVAVWTVNTLTNRVVAVSDGSVDTSGLIAVSPDGASLWTVSSHAEDPGPATVTRIDLTTGRATAVVTVGYGPSALVFTRDGRRLYVANAGQGGVEAASISVIDTARGIVASSLDGEQYRGGLTLDPSGSRLLVANGRLGTLTTVDTRTNEVVGSPVQLTGSFLFDAAGHLVQVDRTKYRLLDGTTFTPLTPAQDAPGLVVGAAARAGRLDLLTVADTRSVDSTTPDPQRSPAVTVVDPAQWIAASTLPRRVVVGSRSTTIPFTVSQSRPQFPTTVGLVTPATGRRVAQTVSTPDADGELSGSVTFAAGDVSRFGPQAWTLSAGAASTVDVQGVVVRARSLLAIAATRTGDEVRVVGAAKAYDPVRDTYSPRGGLPVVLQRWTSTGWATLAVLTSDRLGHVSATRRIPFTVGLRLVALDSPDVWGAIAPSVIA